GTEVAVPRVLPAFGAAPLRECAIKLLAYLIGDGGLTQACPVFTNLDARQVADFTEAAEQFGGLKVSRTSQSDERTPSYRVASDLESLRRARRDFAARLRRLLPRGAARRLASALGVTPASFTHWTSGKTV